MFRIGEFSKLNQVSIRMLRYYDEKGLLKPAHIDTFTNYRYYSVEQIPVLHKIIFLRDAGYTINEIASVLQNWNRDYIKKQLEQKQTEIHIAIEKEKDKLQKLETALTDIDKENVNIRYNFRVKPVPACHVISLRQTAPNYYYEGNLWRELDVFMEQHELKNRQTNADSFAIYHDLDYREEQVDIEICVPIDKACTFDTTSYKGISFRTVAAVEKMACTFVYGPYENINGAYVSFAGWLAEHTNYNMTYTRQVCHRGPWNETEPEKYLTELQIQLEEKNK